METIEQYLSILKELNTIETRVISLSQPYVQKGTNGLGKPIR